MAQTENTAPTPKPFKNSLWKYLLKLITVIFGVYIGFMANKYQAEYDYLK